MPSVRVRVTRSPAAVALVNRGTNGPVLITSSTVPPVTAAALPAHPVTAQRTQSPVSSATVAAVAVSPAPVSGVAAPPVGVTVAEAMQYLDDGSTQVAAHEPGRSSGVPAEAAIGGRAASRIPAAVVTAARRLGIRFSVHVCADERQT
ncbi:hypothetical protein GCM10025331_43810 [Actinoplanes utahensis]